MKSVSVCALAAMAMLGATAAWAVSEARPAAPRPVFFAATAVAGAQRLSAEESEERRFLKDAAAASQFAGEASRIALTRSDDQAVRSFAATLINHHASVDSTLQHLLHVRGMAAPMLESEQRKTLNRLAKLHGQKFDRDFMEEVALNSQRQDLQTYTRAGATARDPALKAWIAKMLPTLRYQLTTAERMVPAETRQAKSGVGDPTVSRVNLTTQSMGAGPAPLGSSGSKRQAAPRP